MTAVAWRHYVVLPIVHMMSQELTVENFFEFGKMFTWSLNYSDYVECLGSRNVNAFWC